MDIKVVQNILKANDAIAETNRRRFYDKKVYVIDLMGSPGAGKTSLLVETAKHLPPEISLGVIEGDLATTLDSERLAAHGVPVLQINTGKGCHLDANQIQSALDHFDLDALSLLFIENVGNLVCPAGFDLGQHAKVLVFSTPEGEDKPEKYPYIFQECPTVVINKVDLIPYTSFDLIKVRWASSLFFRDLIFLT
jgi:hydrogenase nickel incorporation protein HypB